MKRSRSLYAEATRRIGLPLLLAATLASGLAGGCRCNKEDTLEPVVFEDGSDRAPVDSNSVLAPPWRPPHVAQLDNGALVHWLHEPDDPAFHVRVLLPTSRKADKLNAAAMASMVEALELRLSTRIRRIHDAKLDIRSGPGRIEIAVHGRDADAEVLLEALADSFADAGESKQLMVAQGKVLARHRDADPSTLAAAGLAAILLEHPIAHEYVAKPDLVALTKNKLDRSWSLFIDPHDALVIVHAGRGFPSEANELSAALERLGSRWKHVGIGLGQGKSSVTTRLRGPASKRVHDTYLLTSSKPAELQVLGEPETRGRAVVMFGRLIPTATVEQRALARISQRLLQEDLDVRLLVAGPISLLAVRVRLSASDPIASLDRVLDRMREFISIEQPGVRIDQVTNLWLGARVVEASLSGEDWTSLWSESIDLAGSDREIFDSMARDSQAMLQFEPAQVREFMTQWFDPKGGEPGWVMVGAGIDDGFRSKLSARITLVD